jgi:hypothetical protein
MFDLKVTDATILELKDGEQRIYIRAEVMAATAQQHDLLSKILNADSRVTHTRTGKSLNGLDVVEVLVTADDNEVNPKGAAAVELPEITPTQVDAVLPTGEDLDTVSNEQQIAANTLAAAAPIPLDDIQF